MTHIFKVHLQLHRIYIFKIQGNGNLDHKIVPWIFYSLQTTSSSMSFFILIHILCSSCKALTDENIEGKGQLFTIGIMAPQHPKSIGEIRLRSTDPFDHPVIDPKYLEDPYDMGCFIRGSVLFGIYKQIWTF